MMRYTNRCLPLPYLAHLATTACTSTLHCCLLLNSISTTGTFPIITSTVPLRYGVSISTTAVAVPSIITHTTTFPVNLSSDTSALLTTTVKHPVSLNTQTFVHPSIHLTQACHMLLLKLALYNTHQLNVSTQYSMACLSSICGETICTHDLSMHLTIQLHHLLFSRGTSISLSLPFILYLYIRFSYQILLFTLISSINCQSFLQHSTGLFPLKTNCGPDVLAFHKQNSCLTRSSFPLGIGTSWLTR